MSAPLSFRVHGVRVRVRVGGEAAEARGALAALFPDFREPETGVAGPADVTLTLDRTHDGWTLDEDPGGLWRAPSLSGILTRLELGLAEALVRAHPGVGLHAGGVTDGDGRALLLPGPGGSGKSSLVAALAVGGHPVLGDDVVLLDEGRAHPFRRLLKVEEPARTLLGLPPGREELARTWPEVSFLHPRELGSRWAEAARPAWVVLPTRAEGGEAVLEERRASEILPTLLEQLVLVPRVGPDSFGTVAEAVDGARCYRLRYGATSDAAELLAELVADGG